MTSAEAIQNVDAMLEKLRVSHFIHEEIELCDVRIMVWRFVGVRYDQNLELFCLGFCESAPLGWLETATPQGFVERSRGFIEEFCADLGRKRLEQLLIFTRRPIDAKAKDSQLSQRPKGWSDPHEQSGTQVFSAPWLQAPSLPFAAQA